MHKWCGIVAVSTNNVIGKEGKLPWYLPEDLENFKHLTENNIVIMGSKTFQSLPKKFHSNGLPNRINIVVTRIGSHYEASKQLYFANNSDIFQLLEQFPLDKKVFVIGGSTIFSLFKDYITSWYVTHVKKHIDNGDTFFDMSMIEQNFQTFYIYKDYNFHSYYDTREDCWVEFLKYYKKMY